MAKCDKCGRKVYYFGCDTNVKHDDDFPIKWCQCKEESKEVAKIELTRQELLWGSLYKNAKLFKGDYVFIKSNVERIVEARVNTAVLAERDRIMAVLSDCVKCKSSKACVECLTEVKKIIRGGN
jgi:hypothetical protein